MKRITVNPVKARRHVRYVHCARGDAGRSQAGFHTSSLLRNPDIVLGTPIVNKLEDLYSLLCVYEELCVSGQLIL